jgi:hypothetical protein
MLITYSLANVLKNTFVYIFETIMLMVFNLSNVTCKSHLLYVC